jgi:glucose-6-phosphate isomerase
MILHYGTTVSNLQVDQSTRDFVLKLWDDLLKKADGKYTNPDDFINLPISEFAKPIQFSTSGLKHVLVIGIGGSSLGPKAVYDTVFGYFDKVTPQRLPKLHFVENIDSKYLDGLMSCVMSFSNSPDYKELAFIFICKSGNTYETLKNIDQLTSDKYGGVVNSGNTYVVSVEGNNTWEWGKIIGAKLFPMPQNISGRFQIFSPVCSVPFGIAGIDMEKFTGGAKQGADNSGESGKLALNRYQLYKNGINEDVYFSFDGRLNSLAEWRVSITAETLGKAYGGITPMVSIGSKDLHSYGQLYLQGQKNKYTTYVSLSDTDNDNLFILDAVKKAYNDAGLPFIHIVLDSINANTLTSELGNFMQSKIIETVLLGGLMGVNPYDQPGVELYKKYLTV